MFQAFLNPLMLAGMAAVSVPIVLHLLNRRKFDRVVWAAMRFLQVSVQQNRRRLRIEDLLLLLLRCLVLILLALALSRPFVRSSTAQALLGDSAVTAVVILDNSYSMGLTDGVATRFELARKAADEALDTLPPGSSVALLLASDVVQPVIPLPSPNLAYVRKAMADAKLCDRPTELLGAIKQAVELLDRQAEVRKEIFVVTDGQASGWRRIDEVQRLLESKKETLRTRLVLVGQRETQNLCVSALRLASGLPIVDRPPLRLEVQVTNTSATEARDVRVSLRLDSEPPNDEATIQSIAPNATRSVSLFAKFRSPGIHTLTALIPPDHLRTDDARSIAVRALSELKVLLVDGQPGREPRDSEIFYLRRCLLSDAAHDGQKSFINVATITADELSAANFTDFNAIVLANVAEISPATADALATYLRGGGGLIVFPGSKTRAESWNRELVQRHPVLPARLGHALGDAAQQDTFLSLDAKGLEHPIAAIWNDPEAGHLEAAHFFRVWELIPEPVPAKQAPAKNGAATQEVKPPAEPDRGAIGVPRVVLRYSNHAPAVMERVFGHGRVVLFSSTADSEWNDLAPHGDIFVPLMHRTLESIVQQQDDALNVPVGGKFIYDVGGDWLGKDATITRPGTAATQDTRKIEMVGWRPALQYDATDLAGIYKATLSPTSPPVFFAVQSDPSESNLTELAAPQLESLASNMKVLRWPADSVSGMVHEERDGTELWLPLLIAALLLAALETVLAQRFSRSK